MAPADQPALIRRSWYQPEPAIESGRIPTGKKGLVPSLTVDQQGVVLDILVQDRRNATAARRFFRRLLAGLKYKPKRLVTGGLRSYGAARRGARCCRTCGTGPADT